MLLGDRFHHACLDIRCDWCEVVVNVDHPHSGCFSSVEIDKGLVSMRFNCISNNGRPDLIDKDLL